MYSNVSGLELMFKLVAVLQPNTSFAPKNMIRIESINLVKNSKRRPVWFEYLA